MSAYYNLDQIKTEIKKEKPAPKHTPAAKQDPVFMKDLPRYEEKIINGADAVEVGVGSRSVLALLDKEKDESKKGMIYTEKNPIWNLNDKIKAKFSREFYRTYTIKVFLKKGFSIRRKYSKLK